MHEILAEWRTLDTSRPTLRAFGWTVGTVLLGIAAFVGWRHGWSLTPVSATLLGVGAALAAFGTVAPLLLRHPYRGWMLLALALGFVTTRVVLTAVFFLVATPTGLLRRALGHDPMRRRRPDGTMWIRRPPDDDPRRRLERTF